MSEHIDGSQDKSHSDGASLGAEDRDALQFDKAEFVEPAATVSCGACKQPIRGSYYQLNAVRICEGCRAPVSEVLARGASAHAFGKAAGLGLLAAIAGTLVYFGISAMTGYQFSLVAILVGYMVGKAVRKGSGGRGGPRYQALAMVLTYCSISATYVPPILKQINRQSISHKAAAKGTSRAAAKGGPAVGADPQQDRIGAVPHQDNQDRIGAAPATSGETATAGETATPAEGATRPTLGIGGFFLGMGYLLLFALAAPFLAGVRNLMGLVIIAIGVYQAWKLTRAVPLSLTGPFTLAPEGGGVGAQEG